MKAGDRRNAPPPARKIGLGLSPTKLGHLPFTNLEKEASHWQKAFRETGHISKGKKERNRIHFPDMFSKLGCCQQLPYRPPALGVGLGPENRRCLHGAHTCSLPKPFSSEGVELDDHGAEQPPHHRHPYPQAPKSSSGKSHTCPDPTKGRIIPYGQAAMQTPSPGETVLFTHKNYSGRIQLSCNRFS